MTVVEAYICGKKIDPPNNKSELRSGHVSLLIEAITQNTTGSVFLLLPMGGGNVEVSRSPTEKAILQWGVNDPCRPNVKDAVRLCIKAGVKVRKVTGDDLQTAETIALECGILESNADVREPNLIEGKTFRVLSEDQRLEVAEKISVMGAVFP